MRFLLTGATGFIGRHFGQALRAGVGREAGEGQQDERHQHDGQPGEERAQRPAAHVADAERDRGEDSDQASNDDQLQQGESAN